MTGKFDVEITKQGENPLGFLLVDHRGRPSKAGSFTMDQLPGLALKFQTGDSEYGDKEPPYASRTQEDMSGGRGLDDFEKDKTRFFDSYRAQTWHDGVVMPGPEETYAKGIRPAVVEHWFADNADADDDFARVRKTYLSYKFTPETTYTPAYIQVALGSDVTGSGSIKFSVYSDSGGEPDAELCTTGALKPDAYEQEHVFDIVTPVPLSAATVYHLVVYRYIPGISPVPDYYYVLASDTVAADTAYQSTDGSTWTAATQGVFFRLLAADDAFDVFPFQHLGSQYFALSFRDGSDPKVYKNGYWGTLVSATPTGFVVSGTPFVVDELIGSIAVLVRGLGADAGRNWRLITDNDTNSGTVATWDITPDDTTQIAVVRFDKCTEVTGHGMTGRLSAVEVINSIVYFCRGDWEDIFHMYADVFTQELGRRWSYMCLAQDSTTKDNLVFAARRETLLVGSATPAVVQADGTVDNLVLSIGVTVGDADMEADDGSWADYNTPDFNTQETLYLGVSAYSGSYFRRVGSHTGDGMSQTFAVVEGANYPVSVRLYNFSTAEKGYFKIDGVLIGTIDKNSTEWELFEGTVTAVAATMTVYFYVDGTGGDLGIDSFTIDTYTTSIIGRIGERITNLLASGSPRRAYLLTESRILYENAGKWEDVTPGDFSNLSDYRNGRVALTYGQYLYTSFGDNIIRYYDGEADLLGPNLAGGLPEERRGEIAALAAYGEWLLVAIDGGADKVSSILVYTQRAWHELYRAPAAGLRITALRIQAIPGNYVDRLWYNEGGDLAWLPLDTNPLENSDYRFTFSCWVDMARVYGSMREVQKFFQSIRVTGDNLSASCYVTIGPRDTDGWWYGYEIPEAWSILWGDFTGSGQENAVQDLWYASDFTLYYLDMHLSFHPTRPTVVPAVRAIVLSFVEQLPVAWSYTLRLGTGDNRRSATGQAIGGAVEDDIGTLKSYLNSAEPVRLETPFGAAEAVIVELTSLSKIESVAYRERGKVIERMIFVITAIDI